MSPALPITLNLPPLPAEQSMHPDVDHACEDTRMVEPETKLTAKQRTELDAVAKNEIRSDHANEQSRLQEGPDIVVDLQCKSFASALRSETHPTSTPCRAWAWGLPDSV